jgi:hypothetical protein
MRSLQACLVAAALIAIARCGDAMASLATQRPAAARSTPAIHGAHHTAGAHAPRRSRPAAARTLASPGPPPAPGYCWYYIDRATRAPGFWDLCRER